MSTITTVFHLPPLWLPESKTLALELTADGRRVVCLITNEELRRRFKTNPDIDGTAAQEVFNAFREGIEQEIHSLLERHHLPPEGTWPVRPQPRRDLRPLVPAVPVRAGGDGLTTTSGVTVVRPPQGRPH